ncbi:hypothetical protein H6F87_26875 [Cyanobacteria bacterium FACHB-502]|nr:hypothetical protein [Cyanobacteria bacterium FACHB-502]
MLTCFDLGSALIWAAGAVPWELREALTALTAFVIVVAQAEQAMLGTVSCSVIVVILKRSMSQTVDMSG